MIVGIFPFVQPCIAMKTGAQESDTTTAAIGTAAGYIVPLYGNFIAAATTLPPVKFFHFAPFR